MRQQRACRLHDSTLSQLLYRGADGCILWQPTCFCGCAMSSSLKHCCMTAHQPRYATEVFWGMDRTGVPGVLVHPPTTFGALGIEPAHRLPPPRLPQSSPCHASWFQQSQTAILGGTRRLSHRNNTHENVRPRGKLAG